MFTSMIETLKANPRKIVFTEGTDARILEATSRLVEGGFLTPVLVGNVEAGKAAAAKSRQYCSHCGLRGGSTAEIGGKV